jgi:alkylation response protein AidB-like acyl-CoA dehydrogenase
MRDYGMERLMRDAKYCQMYPMTPQEALLRLFESSEVL